jgi:hypothetical protein
MKAIILTAVAAISLYFVSIVPATAQGSSEPARPEVKITAKECTGTLVGLGGNFIAVAAGLNADSGAASEYAFNLGKDVQIVHKRSLKEFVVGDTVKVSYEEQIATTPEGNKKRSHTVKTITFLKPAANDLTAQEQTQPQQEVRSEEDGLSLKGERGR